MIASQIGAREEIMIKNTMRIQRVAGYLQISKTLAKGLSQYSLHDLFLRVVCLSVITGLLNTYI